MSSSNVRQIAQLANVSAATVSRVIRNPDMVTAKTRAKVLSAMQRIGYVYNRHAANRRRNTTTVGLIVPTIKSSIHAELIQGVQEACWQNTYTLLIGNTNYSVEEEVRLLKTFVEDRLSGIITAGSLLEPATRLMRVAKEHEIPSVVTWECHDDPDFGAVGIDNYAAAYSMTKYLVDLGHTQIGLILGPAEQMLRLQRRLMGYRNCLQDSDIPFDANLVVERNHSTREGREAAIGLLSRTVRPSAIFAASDVLAFGAISAARELNLSIPEDVTIVGFDDIEFAEYCVPPLTTVRVPGYEMGRRSVSVLLNMIATPGSDQIHQCLQTNIVERASAAPIGKTHFTGAVGTQ